jgi:hypothetical protein
MCQSTPCLDSGPYATRTVSTDMLPYTFNPFAYTDVESTVTFGFRSFPVIQRISNRWQSLLYPVENLRKNWLCFEGKYTLASSLLLLLPTRELTMFETKY